MSVLKQAKTEAEVKKLTVAGVKKAYLDLAYDYNRILEKDVSFCPKCGDWLKTDDYFYQDKSYVTNRYPICKRCLLQMVEQRRNKKDEPNETKESVQKVLQMMDKVYDNVLYENCIKSARDDVSGTGRSSPFTIYITSIQSLPQWRGKTWADSDFGADAISLKEEEINENSRKLKSAKKRFGSSYSSNDLMFLENEYIDWTERYACENKAQELLFKRICFKELEIDKAQREGKDTKELDKTLQDLMSSLSVKPSQSNSNTLTEAKTFGQLIQKWEMEKPIPEPEDEFKDVDKIGLYVDVFFKGHLSKMMGLKNGFSSLYDRFISKYTVTKPQYDEDTDTEVLFDQIFGSKIEEEE